MSVGTTIAAAPRQVIRVHLGEIAVRADPPRTAKPWYVFYTLVNVVIIFFIADAGVVDNGLVDVLVHLAGGVSGRTPVADGALRAAVLAVSVAPVRRGGDTDPVVSNGRTSYGLVHDGDAGVTAADAHAGW